MNKDITPLEEANNIYKSVKNICKLSTLSTLNEMEYIEMSMPICRFMCDKFIENNVNADFYKKVRDHFNVGISKIKQRTI